MIKSKFAVLALLFFMSVAGAPAAAHSLITVAGGGTQQPAVGLSTTEVTFDSYAHRIDRDGNLYIVLDSWYGNPGGGFIRINPWGKVDRIFQNPILNNSYFNDFCVDSGGNVYLAAGYLNQIFRITPAGEMSVYAGNGTQGSGGDGGLALNASLDDPDNVNFDLEGNLYIGTRHSIRKVDRQGVITTVFHDPAIFYIYTSYVDGVGNVYLYDGNFVRKVTPQGEVGTVAGTGVGGYSGDGGPAINAQIGSVFGISGDIWGNIYISDNTSQGKFLRKIDAKGIISTVMQLQYDGDIARLSTDNDGTVYITLFGTFGESCKVFEVKFAPILQSLSPATGSIGERVVLSGRYFGSRGTGGTITFNGVPAPILFWSNETVVFTVPPGATTGNVVVTTPDGQQSTGINFKVR